MYGYCPRCGGLGMSRERRLNGNDRCENGHSYPSSTAAANPLLPVAPETKRADSLALAYREQQGENDALRVANTVLLAERDLYRKAWENAANAAERERAAVVAYLNGCATEGFILLRINEACDAEKWALAIERGEHRREEKK